MKAHDKIVGALEMGTQTVKVLVGEVSSQRALNIIGRGQAAAQGMCKGQVAEPRKAAEAVHAALLAAEKSAGTSIDELYVAQTGPHLSGFSGLGSVTIQDAQGRVAQSDLDRAADNAKARALPEGTIYLHHIRTGYWVDGRPTVAPLEASGERLEISYWHIQAEQAPVSACLKLVNAYGLEARDMILSGLAAGSILALDHEKQKGVLVLDLGAGGTDYVLYHQGFVRRAGVIPVGGDHLTNDLSLGLRVSWKHAESLKLRDGYARVSPEDRERQVMLVGDLMIGDRPLPQLAVNQILQARVEEIFRLLQNKLGSALSTAALPAGVLLTGGGSRLRGICEVAENVLGLPCRAAPMPAWALPELQEPESATVLGLLHYALKDQRSDDRLRAPRRGGWLSRVTALLSDTPAP